MTLNLGNMQIRIPTTTPPGRRANCLKGKWLLAPKKAIVAASKRRENKMRAFNIESDIDGNFDPNM
jgi:hypothetical protein